MTAGAADREAFLSAARGAARQVVAARGAGLVLDPEQRGRLEAVGTAALDAAVEATGLPPPSLPVRVSVVDRAQWLEAALDDLLPYFIDMLDALSDDETAEDPRLLEAARKLHPGGAAGALGLGIGLTIGQLATRALGTYELAVPRAEHQDRLLVLRDNLADFSQQWAVASSEVEAWACLTDAVVHLMVVRPHVRQKLTALLRAYMSNFGLDSELLGAAMAGRIKGKVDPDTLMATLQTPAQRQPAAELRAISAVLFAHAMRVAETGAGEIPPISLRLAEAVRRRRAAMPLRDRLAEFWFGLTLGPAEQRRGERFLAAIAERAGEAALPRLWSSADLLPQPEDLDDPERWLGRAGAA